MIYIVRNLFKIFKTKEKLRFILILLLIFFSLILETIGIGMILPIINILIIKERSLGFDLIDNFFVNFSLKKTFFIYLIIFLIFFLIKNIILSITLFLQIKIVYEIKKNYSKILFREFLYKKYKFYTHTNTSFFLNKLGQSINDFTQSLRFVFNSITDTIFVTILICFLLYLKPLITLTIIIFVFKNSIYS
jgi:ABC-type multidrug transport system fused ATPase/permease subunit